MSVFGYMKSPRNPYYPKVKFEVDYLNETENSTPAVRIIVKSYEDDSYKAIYYFDSSVCLARFIKMLLKGVAFLNRKSIEELKLITVLGVNKSKETDKK